MSVVAYLGMDGIRPANSEFASQVVESEPFSSDRRLRVILDNGADPKTGKSS
jgi:hypothetical protein